MRDAERRDRGVAFVDDGGRDGGRSDCATATTTTMASIDGGREGSEKGVHSAGLVKAPFSLICRKEDTACHPSHVYV